MTIKTALFYPVSDKTSLAIVEICLKSSKVLEVLKLIINCVGTALNLLKLISG